MTTSDLNPNEYSDYYRSYITKALDINLLNGLEQSGKETVDFFKSIEAEKLEYLYSEGKWTIKELLLHIIDVERVFAYRALRFSRKDKTTLPGFDEGFFTKNGHANSYSINDLIDSYNTVRQATLNLFKSFNNDMLQAVGEASGSKMSVRAAGFIIIGHERHHIQIIKERYL